MNKEMTKEERLEYTRLRLDAIPICRLYHRIAEKKRIKEKGEIRKKEKCKYCGNNLMKIPNTKLRFCTNRKCGHYGLGM